MRKVLVSEAAKILGISKEAVYNRIRRGSLKYKESGGVKYVIFDENTQNNATIKNAKNSDFLAFLLTQNAELKAQNERLQKEKEQIIITKIDELKIAYKSSDERLKMIISMIQNPLIQNQDLVQNFSTTDAEILEVSGQKWISLNEFLQNLSIKPKKLRKIEHYLIKCVGLKKFVKAENGVIFVKSKLNYKKIKEKI